MIAGSARTPSGVDADRHLTGIDDEARTTPMNQLCDVPTAKHLDVLSGTALSGSSHNPPEKWRMMSCTSGIFPVYERYQKRGLLESSAENGWTTIG